CDGRRRGDQRSALRGQDLPRVLRGARTARDPERLNMHVGDIIEVEVEGIDERGDGVASYEDRTVLVPGLFPGERGRVQIEALSRHGPRAHAWLRSVVRASPDRRALPCPRQERHP